MKKENKKYTNPEKREKDLKETTSSEEKKADNETDDILSDQQTEEQNKHEQLQQKYDELNDSYLRLHADFDNYRKRTMKEKADIIKSGGEGVLKDILPLVDDVERAMHSIKEAQANEKEAMLQGIDLIYTKFISFLQQHGVKEMETIGETFDPDKFEAITTIPVEDKTQSGKVIDCIQKGYILNEKVIRFPKVIVGE